MSKYCHVFNGVIHDPAPLPTSFENVSNFHLLPENKLNDYGFFEYLPSEKPAYNPITHYMIETLVLAGNKATSEYLIVLMTPQEQAQAIARLSESLSAIVNQHLDNVVAQKSYKNVETATTWEGDSVPQWDAEGATVKAWRSNVWQVAIAIQQAVLSGQRPIPTPEELIAELPTIVWPGN